MINPLNRGNTPEKIAIYKTEPYVIAADVYAEPMQKGRGGWTWYTGSAGWMYQLILESFIGLRREGDSIIFNPCLPADWPSVKVKYRYNNQMFDFEIVQQVSGEGTALKLLVNNVAQKGMTFLMETEDVVEANINA